MYVIKKKINGKEYFYLRKSVREGKKVKSVDVAYLGRSFDEVKKRMKEFGDVKKKEEIKKEKTDYKKMVLEDKKHISIEELATFCKEKGFIFRSSDIYGGFAGFWDFGPLGVELFNNLKKDWWDHFVRLREDIVGIEASVISNPMVWSVSGHLDEFKDIAVTCKKCGNSTKLDVGELGKVNCDKCGGGYEDKGSFNLMFKTEVGALDKKDAYLRGETAQGMFTNFKLVQQTSRVQLPFGIAQIGKCFRNEIAPRDFLFRSREFHIGEFEFFINPDEKKCGLLGKEDKKIKFDFLSAENQDSGNENLENIDIEKLLKKNKLSEWQGYWILEQIKWLRNIGLEEIKIREHTKSELSHYSSATFDVDYMYPFGSKEIAGVADRGQFDLKQHEKESGESMSVFDEKNKKKILPKVIEPTFGMERVFLALLAKAYNYDKNRGYKVLKLPLNLAPVKVAIFPIVKKFDFEKVARDVFDDLKKEFNVVYDKSGSIGRRYARQDEIGTPFCITVDGASLNNKDVTIRDRDTTKQIRVKVKDLKLKLKSLIEDGKIK